MDIVIIGGGVFGCSTEYNLVNQGAKKIVLLDKGDICSGGTSKSCAITLSHYTIEANMHHAVESTKIFEDFDQIVGGNPNFLRTGYIILGSEEILSKMEAVFEMQNKYGKDTEILTPTEAKQFHMKKTYLLLRISFHLKIYISVLILVELYW
ncbi:MAG: hypothetical protein CL935_03835 [Deltaproteobacteria bacterium]|nr:hypothetical protein [Deltaproteobacteria bacterium]